MTRPPNRRRDGFTLIELLIVITIIAILASMSFGAYQKVREAAGRISCSNNLRSLGTGISNYSSSAGNRYPLGNNSKNGNKTVFWTIRDQMDIGGIQAGASGKAVAANVYMCPSRRSAATVNPGIAPADYGWSNSPQSVFGSKTPVLITGITDGISNTILMGHIWLDPTMYASGQSDNPWDTNSSFARNPSPLYKDSDPSGSSSGMGSPHATAVPHLFCDNGVRTISYDDSTGALSSLLPMAWQWNRKAGSVNQSIGD